MRCKILEEVQLQSRSPFPPPRGATLPHPTVQPIFLYENTPAFPFNIIYGVLGAGACRLNLCFFQVKWPCSKGLPEKRGACHGLAKRLPGACQETFARFHTTKTIKNNKNYHWQSLRRISIQSVTDRIEIVLTFCTCKKNI